MESGVGTDRNGRRVSTDASRHDVLAAALAIATEGDVDKRYTQGRSQA
jgi:hypothetical protein